MKASFLLSFVFTFYLTITTSAATVERIEPPFWWTGMNNTSLQLMIKGQNLDELEPRIDKSGLKITEVHRPENSNYIFIDLEIADSCAPGKFDLLFENKNNRSITIEYELFERKEDSKDRIGFDPSDVIYLITPDRFANGDPSNDEVIGMEEGLNRDKEYGRHGGDLKGIENSLDYIKELGFTAIWLNPILENNQPQWSYHGYATTDYYKVDPRFGTNKDYINLVEKANQLGLKMIMDLIVNHCGHKHYWMDDPPMKDWVNNYGKEYQGTNHRKTTVLDPYSSASERKRMVEGWFVPEMPDLNQNNPFVSTYLIQNSIWWIEYAGLQGIRQDTYSYAFKDFLTDWSCAIMDEYPHFNIVGEEWIDDAGIISYWQKDKVNSDGYTSCLPSLMDFPMNMTLAKSLTQKETWNSGLSQLYENLGSDYLYADPYSMVIFPDNHDMDRIFSQVNDDFDLYKMAMTYILTMRGIPQLYYGTEILMTHPKNSSHGIIRTDFPGGWQDDEVNAYNGNGLSEKAVEASKFLSNLLNFRKNNSTFHYGKLMHFEPRDETYVYFRYDENSTFMIVLNKNSKPQELDLARFSERTNGFTIATDINSNREIILEQGLSVPARSSSIFKLR